MRSLVDAISIEGWMTYSELSWLRAVALSMPAGARFFELGAWKGRSTVALDVDQIDLTCVDTFQGAPGDLTRRIAGTQDVYGIFCQNMKRLGLRPRVVRMDALEAAALVPDGSLHGVFNDCDHDLYFPQHFWAWLPKVRPGGLYCGHDYNVARFPTIPRVLRASGLHFWVVPGTSIWALIRPSREVLTSV